MFKRVWVWSDLIDTVLKFCKKILFVNFSDNYPENSVDSVLVTK